MDTVTYDKAAKYAIGHGFEDRVKPVSSIVVHSTSSSIKNTQFTAEAKYLYTSALVSAHYLIGKDGSVVRFLDPKLYVAWHAGNALPEYGNAKSAGIELHHSVGDAPYPLAQLAALSVLLRSLLALFAIPIEHIETHGQIALPGPYVRKTDPADWPHADFITWRNQLNTAPPTPLPAPVGHYRVRGVPIHEAPSVTSAVALGGTAILPAGKEIHSDQVKDGWAHVAEGFIDVKALEAI